MLLANFNRKEHLRHRAVSLRQHGFLVYCVGDVKPCSINRSIWSTSCLLLGVGFSGPADRMALFPIRSNGKWPPWDDLTWQKISTRAERCRALCQITLALVLIYDARSVYPLVTMPAVNKTSQTGMSSVVMKRQQLTSLRQHRTLFLPCHMGRHTAFRWGI